MTTTATPTAAKVKAQARKAAEEIESAFDAFKIEIPNVEIPAAFRDVAEKSMAQAKEAYARMKSAAEEATDVMEETYETARDGALAVGLKAIDATKANADASFAFYKDLLSAKTFADAIELQTAFARKQFDALTGQVREFQEVAQKVAADAVKPARTVFEKAFKDIKAA